MSGWLIGYLAGVLTGPVVVLVWVAWALWRNNTAFMGSM